MVSYLLAFFLLLFPASSWSGQQRQLCLSCHAAHYVERASCSDCHRGNPASERKNIAHAGLREGKFVRFTLNDPLQKRAGERLIDQLACRRCHVSAGRGNQLAVNLDGAAMRRTTGEIVNSIRHPVATMPDFGLNDNQITLLVNTVFAGSAGRATIGAAPVKVHFNNQGKKSEDVFSRKCGSCHRTLTVSLGALGAESAGPNLSGLLSEHYPKTFRNGDVWTMRNLTTWLKNPREIKASARMQPVEMSVKELRELEKILFIKQLNQFPPRSLPGH